MDIDDINKLSGDGDLLPELENRRRYMQYVAKATTAAHPYLKAEEYDTYMGCLAKLINVRTMYDITDFNQAETIRSKVRVGGSLHQIDQERCQHGGMRAAMGHYVKFLKQNK